MGSLHALVDEATVRIGSLFVDGGGFFARSVDSPRVDEMLPEVDVSVPPLTGEGRHEAAAETPAGSLTVGLKVVQWIGPTHPTIVYHHGNGERPFSSSRFSPNTFRDVLVKHADEFDANIVGLRAPFHDGTTREYARKMGDMVNFVAMLVTSVATVDSIIDQLEPGGPVVVSGVSLGGWVTNLHRTYEGTADAYVPMLAGVALGKLFTESAYRRLLGQAGQKNPTTVERILDFGDDFRDSHGGAVYPLLARYDRYVEYDVQHEFYEGSELTVVNRGHITASLKPTLLREHLLSAVEWLSS